MHTGRLPLPTRGRVALLLAGVIALTLLAILGVARCAGRDAAPSNAAPAASAGLGSRGTPRSGLPTIGLAELPVQARETLALVDRGGPYPYRQDGTTFNNFEGLLPDRPRGYYREFTVPTPGEPDRGARRLILGQGGEVYYTDDHYRSFRQVLR